MNDIFEKIEIEDDTSNLFSMTKSLLGWSRPGPPTCFKIENNVYRKQKDLADLQANYCEQKILNIKDRLPRVNVDPLDVLRRSFNRWIPSGGRPKFTLRSVTEKEVGEMIRKLKNSHAFRIDRIDVATIKMADGILIPGITHVIYLSLCAAKFPAR